MHQEQNDKPNRAEINDAGNAYFSDQVAIQKQIESEVNQRLLDYLACRQEYFYALGRDILPLIIRSEIEKQAHMLYEHGVASESVTYQPNYTFYDVIGYFPDEVYHLYRQKGKLLVDALARQWIKAKGIEMFQKKIIYGCIRESLLEIEHWHEKRKNRAAGTEEYAA